MQGDLQQRGPSSWRIRVFVGRDEAGKKRYIERTVRGTKREAQRVMARLVTEVDEGRHVAAASTRFGEVLERWLEIKATVVEPTTLASYRWIADKYVRPALGSLPLDKIRALDLDRLYAHSGVTGEGPLDIAVYRFDENGSRSVFQGDPAILARQPVKLSMMVGMNTERVMQGLRILESQPVGQERLLRQVADYSMPNVSEKVVRIIHSYVDYVNQVVWKKR